MRLVQQLEGAYVRRMRRAVPKPGRPWTICGHAKRLRIEAAVTAGTSLRTISQSYRVSRSAIQRHQASHIQRAKAMPTAAKVPPPLGRTLAPSIAGARRYSGRVVLWGMSQRIAAQMALRQASRQRLSPSRGHEFTCTHRTRRFLEIWPNWPISRNYGASR
jgi:hypothetical protein